MLEVVWMTQLIHFRCWSNFTTPWGNNTTSHRRNMRNLQLADDLLFFLSYDLPSLIHSVQIHAVGSWIEYGGINGCLYVAIGLTSRTTHQNYSSADEYPSILLSYWVCGRGWLKTFIHFAHGLNTFYITDSVTEPTVIYSQSLGGNDLY